MKSSIIAIVGLGYVGLPLAAAFSKKKKVVGFDVDQKKVESLKSGKDPTQTITREELKKLKIQYTTDPKELGNADVIIICVPTPITKHLLPDLIYLEKASETVGKYMKEGAIVVYESTVYPGVTEEVCKPILEKYSAKKCGLGFFLGYSPERINPGDYKHTLSKIVKVVSGSDDKTTDTLAKLYGEIIEAGIHKASSIKVAEAAKVIENTQRDLNIALMNELALIFEKLNINTYEVLEAAGTKWNFHKYYPGLVGGHCIGVDPYYLTFKAKSLGYTPKVILAGRQINDSMHKEINRKVITELKKNNVSIKNANIIVMGITFKENVNDKNYLIKAEKELKELCHHFGADV